MKTNNNSPFIIALASLKTPDFPSFFCRLDVALFAFSIESIQLKKEQHQQHTLVEFFGVK